MKKTLPLFFSLFSLAVAAQDHFSGIKNSNGVGILSSTLNPAELSNLSSKYDINIFSLSVNASNNKIGFNDIINSNNIEDLLFQGEEPVNMRIDAEIFGPGFAMKMNKWAIGITTKANAKLNLIDIDPKLGESINNGTLGLMNVIAIDNEYNQRLNGTSWGELGLSVARNLFENENHKFNAGATLKLLFPGSYTNFGADKFHGRIDNILNEAYLNNTNASLNIAYSGSLTESFNDFNDYSKSLFGKLNGFAADFGFNYQLKDKDNYKINTGVSVKNIGGMTFKDAGNSSTNYSLNIPAGTITNPGLNLNDFQNVDNLKDAETILLDSGYLTKKESKSDIKVKLPTVVSAYVDVKIVPTFFVSLYAQQKLNADTDNDQITTQNVISLTPRFSLKNFELYSPWAKNEISGTTGGFGFRVYGFYLGSSSIVTALASDTKQADVYLGYRLRLK